MAFFLIAGIETLVIGALVAGLAGAAGAVVSYFLAPKPKNNQNASKGRSGNIRSAEAPQAFCFGYTVKGGVLCFINGTGSDNEFLHEFIALAGHEIAGIGDIRFNGEIVEEALVNPSASAAVNAYLLRIRTAQQLDVSNSYAPQIRLNRHLGQAGQVADPDAVAENTQITAAHTGTGIAYLYARLRYDAEVFTSFVPEISAEVFGNVEIYDPRTGLESWSMNPALICAKILELYGVARANIDTAALTAAADNCDEILTDANGNAEPRYTANGYIELDGDWSKAIQPFINAMNGAVVEWNGVYYIHSGRWIEPELTITDADFMGPIARRIAESEQDRANSVKGTFVSPASYDTETEFPAYQDAVALAEDNGRENWLELDLEMVNTATQAQRVARQFLREARLDETITVEVSLAVGLDVIPFDNVIYQSDIFGISQTYRVVGHRDVKRGNLFGVELALKRHEPSVYDWDAATDEQEFVNASTNLPGANDAKNPSSQEYTLTPNTSAPDHDAATMAVTWNEPAGVYISIEIEAVLQVESRQQDDGTGNPGPWIVQVISEAETVASGVTSSTFDFNEEALTSGPYDFQNHQVILARIRTVCDANTFGDWKNIPSA